ncbi:MAG: hypothetical protein ACAI25_09560 [Planctomycetota bacterium]
MSEHDISSLVKALDDADCANFKRGGLAFFHARPEWVALTAPENRAALVRYVEAIGLERMNAAAKEFFTAALAESKERIG